MSELIQTLYSNPLYLAIPVILAMAVVAYFGFIRNRGKVDIDKINKEVKEVVAPEIDKEEIMAKSETGEVNCLLLDSKSRSFGLRYIKSLPDKMYGRQWRYLNHLVYWLVRVKDGEIIPVTPTEDLDHSPGELYEALETKDDVCEVLGPHNKGLDKIKIGLLVLAACVALFLMYLAMKGK